MRYRIKYAEEELKAFGSDGRGYLKYYLAGGALTFASLLTGPIFFSTFYALREDEFAIIEEYSIKDILPIGSGGDLKNLADIPLINFLGKPLSAFGPHKGGSLRIVEYEDPALIDLSGLFGIKIYAHWPFPFAKHHIFSEKSYLEVNIPLIFALTSQQFLVFTETGPLTVYHIPGVVSDIKPNLNRDLYQEQVKPIDIFWLKIRVFYEVADKETYAILLKNNNWIKDLSLEQKVKNDLALHYSSIQGYSILLPGALQSIFLHLLTKHPKFEEYKETGNMNILNEIFDDIYLTFIQDSERVLKDFGFQSYLDSIEKRFGVDLKSFEVEIYKDSIAKSF